VIISENGSKEVVDIGARVTIRDAEYGDQETYTIVGSTEVNPTDGRISYRSPIGRALMSHRRGERVQVETPAGIVTFEILSIA
jgi:transcription elongation factor GreA